MGRLIPLTVQVTAVPLDRIGIQLNGKYFAGSRMMTRLWCLIDMFWYDV